MKENIKSGKGITLVSLVVTIIILIILAGVSINSLLGTNGLITIAKRAKENMELAQIEEQEKLNELYMQFENDEGLTGGEINYDIIAKLNNFKKAIADYIEEAGGEKPEYTADIVTFGDKIKGIVKEVTKNATATEQDITEGKTAWVNGSKIVGTKNINEGKYYEPYIPKGFKYKEGDWNNGYTIIGETENVNDEFVWVPCVLNQSKVKEGDTVVTFEKTVGEKCYPYYPRYDGILGTNKEGSNASEIIESVGKYGGFYIAKYEAGIEGTKDNYSLSTETKVDGTVKPLSQANKGVWNNITITNAINVSKLMINEEKTGVKSTLVSGEVWDTTLQWMVKASSNKDKEPNKNYDINSAGKGWYNQPRTGIHTTGYFSVNNIYDMAGNVYEWTSELHSSEEFPTMCRGGYFEQSGAERPAACRENTGGGSRDLAYGFRVVMYK